MITFTTVSGMPILTNSQKVRVAPLLFSAFCMIITLLAAPRIERLPAIVLPAASAIISFIEAPICIKLSASVHVSRRIGNFLSYFSPLGNPLFSNSSNAANHFSLISSFQAGSKLGNLASSILFHED